MRVIWFIVLAALAFALGAFGSATWLGAKSVFASFRVVCQATIAAEQGGILTRAQISDSVDRLARRLEGAGHAKGADMSTLINEIKAGCPSGGKLLEIGKGAPGK